MIDWKYRAIDRGQFRCILQEMVINGKVLLSQVTDHWCSRTNLCSRRWRQYQKCIFSLQRIVHIHMALQLDESHFSECNHSNSCAVQALLDVLYCFTIEALAVCKCGTHCVTSSQCHPRDYHGLALEILMKPKAWTNNGMKKKKLHQLGGWKWMMKETGFECWFKWVHLQILLDMISLCHCIIHYWAVALSTTTSANSMWFLHNIKKLLSELVTINQRC